MRPVVRMLGAGAVGYAIGCVSVANAVARRHGVPDLRDRGDGNPGYWNARAQIGPLASTPIFVGDVAKGAAAAVGARWLGGPWWLPQLGGGAAMVGHAFPAQAGWRGGRSVLTFVGAAIAFAPRSAALSIGVLGAVWATTRRFDVAARVGMAAFPVVQLATEGARRTAVTGILMTFIGVRFAQLHAGHTVRPRQERRPDTDPTATAAHATGSANGDNQ